MTTSFFDNSRGRQAIEVSGVFTGLATIFVALRLYTRFFIIRCAGIEDFGIALAMLCSIGLTACIGAQAKYGLGRHIGSLSANEMIKCMQAFWSSLIVYYLALGLTKGSILLQYRRIFTTRSFQIACWTNMAIVICYTIWAVFGSIFACVPVRAFWTREKASCINQSAMWFTNAAINIATDFAIIILPIPVIRSLNLGRRQRVGLITIFAVGGVVCIVSIMRLQTLVAISNSQDPTFDNVPAATWSSVETNVGIICSCLPLLRPLLARWIPKAFPSRKRSILSLPQHPATYGSRRDGKGSRFHKGYASEVTKNSRCSDDEMGDIQVVTDIRVHVEDSEGPLSGWKTPTSTRDWADNNSGKAGERAGSTEVLVETHGRATP